MLKKDIAISGSKIVSSSGFLPDTIINASDCLVTPGLIDFHLHCLESVSDIAVPADMACLPNGITTCIDAGTAGCSLIEQGFKNDAQKAKTTVLALIHTAPQGMVSANIPEDQDPTKWDIEKLESLVGAYPDFIVGLKTRMSDFLLAPFHLKMEALRKTLELGDKLKCKVVVHVNNPGLPVGEIADMLRPGDVFCHVYAGTRENILTKNGCIDERILKARERGVLFDACNGRKNFLTQVAQTAIEQNFLPDFISSDNNISTYNMLPLVSLPWTLSKYLALGLSIPQVFDRAILSPSRWLNKPRLATLEEGTVADIALWKIKEKKVEFPDYMNGKIFGSKLIVPHATIKNGAICFSSPEINFTLQ
ncbi:MAG: amidohydrolase family protein [Spirochaetia bacterium]|nr:amidohydrolase family protein [Spirochaetia bacterium]